MNTKFSARSKLCLAIFLIILLISSFFVIRILTNFKGMLEEFSQKAGNFIYEKTSLHVSYKNLSPSILSGFNINEIEIYDDEKKIVLSVNKIRISYDIFKIGTKDLNQIVTSVTLDGLNADIDFIIETLKPFFSQNNGFNFSTDLFVKILEFIPGRVNFRNISLSYENEFFKGILNVKKIDVENFQGRNRLDFDIEGNVFANIKNLNEDINGKAKIEGYVTQNLEGSSLNVSLSDLGTNDFRINTLSFLLRYSNQIITLESIRSLYPLSFYAGLNIAEKSVFGKLDFENLFPFRLVTSQTSRLISKLKSVNMNGNINFFYAFGKNDFELEVISDINLPSSILKNGAVLSLNANADARAIHINSLGLSGKDFDASANLDFIYENLSLSGIASLSKINLLNGNTISTEIFFDPLEKGFTAFSPQIFIGEKSLTAFEFSLLPNENSLDFEMEVSDYSHSQESEPGVISFGGSYILDSKYIQSEVALTEIYLDSILSLCESLFLTNDSLSALKNMISSFVFSGNGYFSTDFESLSYNVPYIVVADTKNESSLLLMSFNGNTNSIQMDNLTLALNGYLLTAFAGIDFVDFENMIFSANIIAGTIPYSISGTYAENKISFSGDYGLFGQLNFLRENSFDGFLNFENFPLKIKNSTLIFSLDSDFSYSKIDGPLINVNQLSFEESGLLSEISPHLVMSAGITKYGASITDIVYSDFYSVLEGNGDVTVNINDYGFYSANVRFNLENTLSTESVNADIMVSNPDGVELSLSNVSDSLYMNAQVDVVNFSLNRFSSVKNDNNELSASLFATGTINHPDISVTVSKFALMYAGDLMQASGFLSIQEDSLVLNSLDFSNGLVNIKNTFAEFNLDDFSGYLQTDANLSLLGKSLFVPLKLEVSNVLKNEGSFIPKSGTVTIFAEKTEGDLLHSPLEFFVRADFDSEMFVFSSSQNLGFSALYSTKTGEIFGSLNSEKYLNFSLSGNASSNQLSVKFSKINADLKNIFDVINLDDLILVENGILNGSVSINGSAENPDFSGAITIENPEISLPTLIPEKISSEKILITLLHNEITVIENSYSVDEKLCMKLSAKIYLNKWMLDRLEFNVKSLPNVFVPVFLKTPVFSTEGNVNCDMNLIIEGNICYVSGNIFGDNIKIQSDLNSLSSISSETSENEPWIYFNMDLNLSLGTHSSLDFNPLLRCVFTPDIQMNLKFDQQSGALDIGGNLNIRSGDIAYLNRNFYIKQGEIKFNSADITNPLITVEAETREKDDDGQTVRIILSAQNQYLRDFNPRFSSVPAKSETEISALLGQIVIGDAGNVSEFMFAAGDYAIQSAIGRNVENKLRDLFNFDIFSMRTNIVQNTLNLGLSNSRGNSNNNANQTPAQISVGNFLDNSTVYIGKYLGSSVYVDAMMHFSFENANATDVTKLGDFMLQPEIGIELDSPFANIRWSVAPDINAMINENNFVPDSSVSLSWKFAF